MIPKILHQIWFGKKPFRKMELRESFMKKNPDWSFMLWTDENLPSGMDDTVRKVVLDSEVYPIVKGDILRFELLYLMGGVYCDLDYICYKNLDDLLNCKSFCAESYQSELCNSFVGSEKYNDFMRLIAVGSAMKVIANPQACNENPLPCGVKYHSQFLRQCEVVYPREYFLPFSWMDTDGRIRKYEYSENYPDSYVAHLWMGMEDDGWTKCTAKY